jgi:hypothetical protein
MARISITTNSIDPQNTTSVSRTDCKTLNEYVSESKIDFPNDPWILVLVRNGKKYYPLKNEWDDVDLKENDNLHFIHHVGEPISIIIAVIIVVAVAAVLFLSVDPPSFEDNRTQPDPLYTLDGRKNQARLNNPIEDAYGRNKLWVSYLSTPYSRYVDNEQDLFQVFSLGQGADWNIENLLIEDSPASSFTGFDFRYDEIDYFPNNVSTSREVSSLELFGSNQSGYNELNDGYVGGFSINPPNTLTNKIEIDYSLPNGCYVVNDSGSTRSLTVTVDFEARTIDNDGNPTSLWSNIYSLNLQLATNQPVRVTKDVIVTSGRYEVRAKRTNEAYTGTRGSNKFVWDGVKAYLGDIAQPSGMKTLNIKTRASQNTVKNKVNVLATRKIPVWDDVTGWSQPVVSRNPIWAMVNILKADYGGRMTDDDLNLPALKICADLADDNDETFDYVFDQKTTVWDAIKICCFACRSVPLVQGNKVSARRDVPDVVPVQLFNSENIYENSFKITRTMPSVDDEDGLSVEYYDQSTWRDETYLALLDHQQGINPKKLKLRGVTNRQQASRLGYYTLSTNYNNRVSVKFETTQSAMVSEYGDLIKIQHDVPNWASGGFIDDINGSILTLSEKPNFKKGYYSNKYVIWVRDKIGDIVGPYKVQQYRELDNTYKNKIELLEGSLPLSDFPINDNSDRPHYILGSEDDNGMLCRITSSKNNGLDKIEINAVVENYKRFEYDGFDPSDITYPPLVDETIIELTTFDIDLDLSDDTEVTFILIPVCIPDPTPPSCKVFDYIQLQYSTDGFNFTSFPVTQPSDLTNDKITLQLPVSSASGFYFRNRVQIDSELGPWSDNIFYNPNADVILASDDSNITLEDNSQNNLYTAS